MKDAEYDEEEQEKIQEKYDAFKKAIKNYEESLKLVDE
jgi:hypothetical protein